MKISWICCVCRKPVEVVFPQTTQDDVFDSGGRILCHVGGLPACNGAIAFMIPTGEVSK